MYELTNINGATFIFSLFKNLETASLGIFLKIGSRYEDKNLRGISHFLEHILFKGSKKYSYRQIKREIEGRGGSLNGFTSQEITAYYAHFLKKNLEQTLDILLDMVFNPTLSEKEINKERNVILEEIKMYNDLPSSRVVTLLDKLLWPTHPLGEEVIGDFATVKRIGKKDLLSFKNRYYEPCNIVISCSGDFNQEKIKKLLDSKIRKTSLKANLKDFSPSSLVGQHIKVEEKKLEQSHLCIGFRSVSYFSKEKFVAELINVVLGANMSSRLFEEIRDKKALCYEISSDVRKYKDSGAFVIHVGLDKSKINVALVSILKELSKIREKNISDKELARAKDYILGQIAMGLERPQGMMAYLAENYLTLEKIYTLEDIKREIGKISGHDIKKLAQKIFKFENICVSCVGDLIENQEEKIRSVLDNNK